MPVLDPLIIQSFPAPPTHIPLSTSSPISPNPPLTLPPDLPLPPIPGPSRLFGRESFFLLNHPRRRASKVSLLSTDSPYSCPSSASSSPTSQSYSNTALTVSDDHDAGISGAVSNDADLDAVLSYPPASPFRSPHSKRHHANESIASIDVRDILAATTGTSDIEHDSCSDSPVIPPSFSDAFPLPPQLPCSPPSPDIPTILSSTPRPIRSRVSSATSAPCTKSNFKPFPSDGQCRMSKSKPRLSEPSQPTSIPPRLERRTSWVEHDEFGCPIAPILSDSPLPMSGSRSSVGTDCASDCNRSSRRSWKNSSWEARRTNVSDGEDSDSSIDLHTPLPHLMLKHGVLSPNSKLFKEQEQPQAPLRDSVLSLVSTKSTSSAFLKDSRDTECRRIRHRDGRLLRGGIGLTTGLGWSDSEDEDAPSALTSRLSTINLGPRASFASFLSTSSLSHSSSTRSLSAIRGPSQLSRSSSFAQTPPSSFNAHAPVLTQSLSSGVLNKDSKRQGRVYDELDEWGVLDSSRWSSGSQTLPSNIRHSNSSSSSRTSSSSKSRQRGSTSVSSRLSVGMGSARIPEDQEGERAAARPGSVVKSTSTSTTASSPSTASTRSIPYPITPRDSDNSISVTYDGQNMSTTTIHEKSLPPLPPSLRRVSAKANPNEATKDEDFGSSAERRGRTLPRAKTPGLGGANIMTEAINYSTASLGRKTPTSIPMPRPSRSLGQIASTSSPGTTPRPLRLATSPAVALPHQSRGQVRDRPAVPVPIPSLSASALSVSMSPRNTMGGFGFQRRSAAASDQSSPTTPSPTTTATLLQIGGDVRPKPRTGTGMAYRNSGGGLSRLKLPSAIGSSVAMSGRSTPVKGFGTRIPPV